MLSLRLVRKGKKHHPIYRLIVQEKTKNPQSNYLEGLGTYNPHTKEKELNKERILHWLDQGAQPTETTHNILVDEGIIKKDKVRASKSKPGKKKAAEIEAKKAEEATAKEAEAPKEEAKEEKPAEETKEEAPKEEVPVEKEEEKKA